ncbi:MAG: carbamoyltransferase HypF [Candidatus Bathyarchaeota archaeon]|nr:carbamoyltransferase HypF [Candidatus Bathyarchaeota archaeon]
MKRRAVVTVQGLVQGIGFRPFVYRLAVGRGLRGYVKNMGDAGVRIDVSGEEGAIKAFLRDIEEEKIPVAVYTKVDVDWLEYSDVYEGFTIDNSDLGRREVKHSLIPPDAAICDDCLGELFDPGDRHYLYPFTCCAICGPRFTTITDIPYDRERTTMVEFPLCGDCSSEFYGPLDRRFNAQTICCPQCGPRMTLFAPDGLVMDDDDPLKLAAGLLDEGYVLAIKGIGGVHLATKTTEDGPLITLRERRRKPGKPFAIMSPSLEEIESYALTSERERELLTSLARPIVALRKLEPFPLSDLISPGLHTVGVMLPYSGIHHVLFRHTEEPALVMTSANFPGEPMIVSNEEALERLGGIADYLLLHDREICARCDDSVMRVVDGAPLFLRRSRGYVPLPVQLPFTSARRVIAVGPELASTACVLKEDKGYPTQHLGDIESPGALAFLREAIGHMVKLLMLGRPDAVALDLHPSFLSRTVAEELAEESGAALVEVQHHHAHLAAVMAENDLESGEEIVGVMCDGYGYGSDGSAWGGEILVGGYDDFRRVGHLEPQPMPGGDLSALRYGRMLQGILYGELPRKELGRFLRESCLEGFKLGEREIKAVFAQLERGFNTPMTTSVGRLLDAVSCLLGVSFSRTYEGEGAMKLEAAAASVSSSGVDLPVEVIEKGGVLVLKTSQMVRRLYELRGRYGRGELASALQGAVAEGLSEMALRASEEHGLGTVGFSGGVAYNEMINGIIRNRVEETGLKFIRHRQVPPGDGGVSLGQAVVASLKDL